MKTQTERVLAVLRQVGAEGLTKIDFQLPEVIDGGAPILHVGGRIEELRKDGHHILSAGRRNRCVVYVLKAPAGMETPPVPATPPPSPPVGDGGVAAPLPLAEPARLPRCAIFDDDLDDVA